MSENSSSSDEPERNVNRSLNLSNLELGDEIRIIEHHRIIGIEDCGDVLTLRTDSDDPTPYRWIAGKVDRDTTVEVVENANP